MDPAPLPAADLAAARAVAVAFLEAVSRGDEAAARAVLIVRDGETVDFHTMHASMASYALGEATAEGAQVVAIATITARPGTDAPPALPMVLAREGRAWKIDMGASINKLMGVDLEALVKGMAEGLGNALAQGLGAIGEGLSALSATTGAEAPAETPPVATKHPGKRSRRKRS